MDIDIDTQRQRQRLHDDKDKDKDEQPSPLDEFKEFLVELWDMIKADFRNSWQFISSNRSFFATAALLTILLQVSSISNLGASFEKYCGQHGSLQKQKQIQNGGGGAEPQVLSYQDVKAERIEGKEKAKREAKTLAGLADAQVRAEEKASGKKLSRSERKQAVSALKEQGTSAISQDVKDKMQARKDAASLKTGKAASIAEYKEKKAEAREQEQLMKANKERISFFENIKKKFQSTLSPSALGGPLFGQMDLIFDSVKNVFYIIAILLTVAGVLSLPVLVFLIITYYVFKTMVSKFLIL